MIKHSEAYGVAVTSDSRKQSVRAIFDLYDPDMVVSSVVANDESIYSKTDQIVSRGADETTEKIATLETDRWKLDGTWDIAPDNPADTKGQYGWWTETISSDTGEFSEPFPYVEQTIENVEVIQGISIQFSKYDWNGIPDTFVVEIYAGSQLEERKEFTGNKEIKVVYDGFTVNFPTKIKLIVKKWSIGNRRSRIIRFLAGFYEEWDGEVVKNVDILTESTFSGLSIPYSTCSIEVYNENKRFDPYSPSSIFRSIEERQAIKVSLGMRLQDKSWEWIPGGTYFQQSGGWSILPLTVQWNLLDIIGMLVNRRFVVPEAEEIVSQTYSSENSVIEFSSEQKLGQIAEGQLVKLNENGIPVEFYVAKHDYEADLNGAGRTLLVRKDVHSNGAWNESSVNTYAVGTIDTWFNTTYLSLLDHDIQVAAGTTKFYYTPMGGNTSVSTLERAVFALSATELGASDSRANIEGSFLPTASKLKNLGKEYWIRTPDLLNTNASWIVTSSKLVLPGSACINQSGYRPCFTLPSILTVLPDGTVQKPVDPKPPEKYPTTLGEWVEAIMKSLGTNFRKMYIVDSDIADTRLIAKKVDVEGKFCGELLRFACMATNTWPHQDFATGKLRISKFEYLEGNSITLDNMPDYAVMSENAAISDITFSLDSGEVTFPGTNTESENSLSVKNPFVHTEDDARKAFFSCMFEYGGKMFSVKSRGNPTSETGDIMSVQTQFNTEISARLKKQQIKIEQGVMRNLPSELVQSPNDSNYENKVVLTGSGTYTGPAGVTKIKITLIQGGTGGTGGGGGIMTGDDADETPTTGGDPGLGGKVYIAEIDINDGQQLLYSSGSAGIGGDGGEPYENGKPGTEGGETTFGQFSSANGKRYPIGIMDVKTGAVYATPGNITKGLQGCGGLGGKFGEDGYQTKETDDDGNSRLIIHKRPKAGTRGQDGKPGCVIVEW